MNFIKKPVKGMNDFLPSEMRLREHIMSIIRETYSSYGFLQIETPAIEHIENLTSKQGGDNEKLIFRILRRGDELKKAAEEEGELADSGLRYDLTVPLARYYANNSAKLPVPFKSLQMGSVWRADNPQKGRFRQFTQCDIDILGDETNLAEIELLSAASDVLTRIFSGTSVRNFTIHVNDRRILRAAALDAGFREEDISSVLISLDKFDKIGLDGIRSELYGLNYSEETVGRYLSSYGRTENITCSQFCSSLSGQYLDSEVIRSTDEIINCADRLTEDGTKIVFDPTLVRGMGYYTGTVFEISIDKYSYSIAGGGRYDEMIGKFSGQDVCASGVSLGFERIVTALQDETDETSGVSSPNAAFLIDRNVSGEKKLEILAEARMMRSEGVTVTVQPMRKNIKSQIEKLESEGFSEFHKIYSDQL